MIVQKKGDGGAMGGKTARACDNCVRKRARWYCAADDAFLCQSCDGAVHSANPLARRHERVRLKTASLKNLKEMGFSSEPTWHRGFTKKARTPRSAKAPPPALSRRNPVRLVPECGGDETSVEETEEQLLYRVPAYDPFEAELCSNRTGSQPPEVDHLHGFLPSEMDLAEFAADVESLLGKGLENESFGMEGLGLRECDVREREMMSSLVVKLEDDDTEGLLMTVEDVGEEGSCHVDATELDTFELNFDDYNSAMSCGEEDDEKLAVECKGAAAEDVKFEAKKKRSYKEAFLKLDHDAVIVAWSGRGGLPWTGERPDLSLVDDCWPHCLGICGEEVENPYRAGVMGGGGYGGQLVGILGDTAAGREAKVSRYREKRRTRLFSKKIRYEVRKLNAEKRPRMKGRFVKRASFGAPPTSFPLPPVLTK